jgi:hypothetical protein
MSRFSKRAIFLLVSGILIQLASFFGEHAAEITIVTKTLTPSYYHASRGLEHLRRADGEALVNYHDRKPDEGCKELSAILLKAFKEKPSTSLDNAAKLTVEKITFESGASLNKEPIASLGSVGIFVDGPGTTNWQAYDYKEFYLFADLQNDVEKLKEPNLILFCLGLFVFGTILDVLAFIEGHNDPDNFPRQTIANEHKQSSETKKEKE